MNNIITLKTNSLIVNFDLHQGGMPVSDNFGYIHRYGIEIGWIGFPNTYQILYPNSTKSNDLLLQSTAEPNPKLIEQTDYSLSVTGLMQKANLISPHAYKLNASVKDNKLFTNVELNAKIPETCLCSKVWIMTKYFEKVRIGDKIIDFTSIPLDFKTPTGNDWIGFATETHNNPPKEVILYNDTQQLKIDGYSSPPVYFSLIRYQDKIIEVVFGWAERYLSAGLHKGEMNLTYEK